MVNSKIKCKSVPDEQPVSPSPSPSPRRIGTVRTSLLWGKKAKAQTPVSILHQHQGSDCVAFYNKVITQNHRALALFMEMNNLLSFHQK